MKAIVVTDQAAGIDPFLSDIPSWDKGWIGSRAGEDVTRGGGR